jgi:Zn-dependent protease
MRKDDVIIEYDGILKLSTGKLADRIAEAEPGLSIPVIFVRDGREHNLSLPSGPLGILMKDTVVHIPAAEELNSPDTDSQGIAPSKPGRRITVGLVALAFKFGPKIGSALFSIFKGLKVGKVGLAAASMTAYSCLLTWQFALLIMFALFVHESGHIWAMKRSGLKTKGIYFIPLLGAAAVSDGEFPSRRSEAFIALMGPIWGLAFAAETGGLYFVVKEPILAAATGWMAAVNLFNLLPVNPLDGGRVFKSIAYSTSSWLGLGFLILGVVVTTFVATAWGEWACSSCC